MAYRLLEQPEHGCLRANSLRGAHTLETEGVSAGSSEMACADSATTSRQTD